MKTFTIIFFIFTSLTLPVLSQQGVPGGVKGLCLWNKTTLSGSQASMSQVSSSFKDTFPAISGKAYSLNNNPAVYFNGKTLSNTLDLGQLKGYAFFTICQSTDTASEQVIFCTEGDSSTGTVLTDRRLASLSDYKYANYDNKIKTYPRIYSYCQRNTSDSTTTARALRLGQIPRKQNLPVKALSGVVPEIILYGRTLSYRERLRVESYLSLKYGIPLDQTYGVNYLNSNGDTIWNSDVNAKYAKNIAGIGRDDASGLYQKASECVTTPGLLSVSFKNEVKDKSFVIWGDNGKSISFDERYSLPKCMLRDWRLNTTNATGAAITLRTDALAIEEINPLSTGETYWLMIDRSGKGTYPFGKTTFVKCDNMSSQRDTITFSNVKADSDTSGADVFTLLAMPELFARVTLLNPGCSTEGTLETEIVGGTAPYTLVLTPKSNNGEVQKLKTENTVLTLTGLSQGGYTLTVTDANKQTYSVDVWATNSHNWECSIQKSYTLGEGQSLTLDASKGMSGSYTYSWTTANGETTSGASITISSAGEYYLTVTDASGCSSILQTTVSEEATAAIEAAEVFPNPTDGEYVVRAQLSDAAALTLTVTDASGKEVSTTTLKGDSYYWYNGTLTNPGLYFITLETVKGKKTMKIVKQ